MGFLDKIFNKEKEESPKIQGLKEIGELDCCPNCKTKLDKIPLRKTKCPHCSKFIYSRKRPLDNKKVLLTESQRDEIELEWTRFYEANEKEELMQNDEYAKAKQDLTKQFGKEPSLNDIKWRVFNQRTLTLAMNKQWGLFRNNKLDMAKVLMKENKNKQALSTLFEVCYLDLNGCNNVGTVNGTPLSTEEMERYGVKEFNPKKAFLAPGIISMTKDLIDIIKISKTEQKKIFVDINKKTKPLKNMPVSEEQAWNKLSKEL